MSNFGNLMRIFSDAADLADPGIARARESILAPIRDQQELRFFVDGTANLGHQAATIHIMRRIISTTGYRGRVTIVYADILPGMLGPTPHKLSLLLPGLDPERIDTATLSYGECRQIRFLNYDRRAELVGEARFGFTAGADDMNINFARELRVERFLRLQPYLWDDEASKKSEHFYVSSRIETPAGEYFYPVDDYPPFRAIPFKYDAREYAVPAGPWDPDAALWPVYGLHQFRDRLPRMVGDLVSIAGEVQRAMSRRIALILVNPPVEVGPLDSREVNVVLTGPLHNDVYNSLYANCALPGVFEGQNTSSLVLSLGRPFLQLRRESSEMPSPYPAKIGGGEFADMAARADAAATALRDGRPAEVVSFVLDARNPSSDVHRYFQELGRYYQHDIHDKLFAGLVALALVS
jgi:hypothetical protein